MHEICKICAEKLDTKNCVSITNYSGSFPDRGEDFYHRECFENIAGESYIPDLKPPGRFSDHNFHHGTGWEKVEEVPVVRTRKASWSDVCYDFELSASVAAGNVFETTMRIPPPTHVDYTRVAEMRISGSGPEWNNTDMVFWRHSKVEKGVETLTVYTSGSQALTPRSKVWASYYLPQGK